MSDLEEEYPGQRDEYRRQQAIEKAVEAADRILMKECDGSVEDIDYLTARVAEKFVSKVLSATQSRLLRKELNDRAGRQRLRDV